MRKSLITDLMSEHGADRVPPPVHGHRIDGRRRRRDKAIKYQSLTPRKAQALLDIILRVYRKDYLKRVKVLHRYAAIHPRKRLPKHGQDFAEAPTRRLVPGLYQPKAFTSGKPSKAFCDLEPNALGDHLPHGMPHATTVVSHQEKQLSIKVIDVDNGAVNEAVFRTQRTMPLEHLMKAFSTYSGRSYTSLRFLFDGLRVRPTDQPETVSLYLVGSLMTRGHF